MIFDEWVSLKKGQEIELLLKTSLKNRVIVRKWIKKDDIEHQRTYELDEGTKIDLKIRVLSNKAKIRIENDDELCLDAIKGKLGINI